MKNKLLKIEAELLDNNEGIISHITIDGNHDDIMKGASLGVSELIRMIARDSSEFTESDIYNIINVHIVKDVFENVR